MSIHYCKKFRTPIKQMNEGKRRGERKIGRGKKGRMCPLQLSNRDFAPAEW
jgi:hypothetical protein